MNKTPTALEQELAGAQGATPPLPLRLILATGEEANEFLQGQLTTDLRVLAAGQMRLSAWCTPKGRVWTTLRVWKRGDQEFGLIVPEALAEAFVQRMRMYILRARVTLEAQTDAIRGLVRCAADAGLPLAPGEDEALWIGDADTTIDAPDIAQAVWQARRMLAGEVRFHADLSDRYLPQMLNLDQIGGLDFNKGCYPGQEPIARVHYRGKVARRMVLGAFPAGAAVAPEAAVTGGDGEKLGEVIAVTQIDGACLAQAVVPAEAAEQPWKVEGMLAGTV